MPSREVTEHEKRHEVVNIVALRWPRAWSEAASALIEPSRLEIVSVVAHGTKYEADDARVRHKALVRLEAFIGLADGDEKISLPPLRDDDDDMSQNRALVELSRVLCPRGWREKILPFFSKVSQEAWDAYMAEGSAEELFLYRETQAFIRRLEWVEVEGSQAADRITAEMQGAA